MRNELNWRFVGVSLEFGPIQFRPDGGLAIGKMVFDKTCNIVDCGVGGNARMDYAKSLATITAPDAIHHFRHIEGKGWHYAKVPNASSGTKVSTPRTAAVGLESFTLFLICTGWAILWIVWCVGR